eukprot:gene29504-51516_t
MHPIEQREGDRVWAVAGEAVRGSQVGSIRTSSPKAKLSPRAQKASGRLLTSKEWPPLSADAVASRNANGTLALLTVIYVFNFIDRQILNILAEPIARELSLSDTQIGLMTGFAFAVFYTFLGIPLARYADRPDSDRITLMAICLAVWSAMTAACGLAQNFGQLLLARIGVGAGEAGCTPAAISIIADIFPKDRRSSAMGIYMMGVPIGSLFGLIGGGWMAD